MSQVNLCVFPFNSVSRRATIVSFKGEKFVLEQNAYVASDCDGHFWYEAAAVKLSDLAKAFEKSHGKKLEEKDIFLHCLRSSLVHSNGETLEGLWNLELDIDGYNVIWDLIDPENYGEEEDESGACDWDNPTDVYFVVKGQSLSKV